MTRTDSRHAAVRRSHQHILTRQLLDDLAGGRLGESLSLAVLPSGLGRYRRITDWSASQEAGHATVHVFRKTSLQYARDGEDLNREVASDARLSESVMMTNYVRETDKQMRQRSNRTYHRIEASLSLALRRRYGYVPSPAEELEEQLQVAQAAKTWRLVAELAAKLESHRNGG
ncbi:MAG: hypothetical protein NTY19_08185 [Planctomycetota bacterium]|nr:hypothetical protein [Planctomycetota bacterium]